MKSQGNYTSLYKVAIASAASLVAIVVHELLLVDRTVFQSHSSDKGGILRMGGIPSIF